MTLDGAPQDANRFLATIREHAPEIFKMADIGLEILCNKDSSNMMPKDWVLIARRLNHLMTNNNPHWDAFVVIHGTDTMSFTACALSYMLKNIPKPIILTGSQRPLTDFKTDAVRNLVHAVELAVEGRHKEISVFFDTHLLRGNRSKKISIPSFHAFESPNYSPLAKVGVTTEHSSMAPLPKGNYEFDPRIETRIACLTLFPGIDIDLFTGLIQKGVKGLVLQAFGPGDIPLAEHSVVELIRALSERGIPTVITSQAQSGSVDLSLYETGRAAAKAGAISAKDMTWEAAMTKMMILLGRGYSISTFRSEFAKSLAGEVSE